MSWLDKLLVGEPGAAGSVFRDGAGAPSNSLGIDGDYYLNTTNGDYYAKASGAYSIVGNLKGPAGATGATGPAGADGSALNTMWWSPVDYGTLNQTVATNSSGSTTTGCQFALTVPATITGVRFYWAGGSGNVKGNIWRQSSGALLATKTIAVSGAGYYTATFTSPLAIQNSDHVARLLVASMWDTSGGHYTSRTTIQEVLEPAAPFLGGPKLIWNAFNRWVAGDQFPASAAGSERYYVEPVFTIP